MYRIQKRWYEVLKSPKGFSPYNANKRTKERNRYADMITREELISSKYRKINSNRVDQLVKKFSEEEKPPLLDVYDTRSGSFRSSEAKLSKLTSQEVIEKAKKIKPLNESKNAEDMLNTIDQLISIDTMSPKLLRGCMFIHKQRRFSDDVLAIACELLETLMNEIEDKKFMSRQDILRLYVLRKVRPQPIKHDVRYFAMMYNLLTKPGTNIEVENLPRVYILNFFRDLEVAYNKEYIDITLASMYADALLTYCFENSISFLNIDTLLCIGSILKHGHVTKLSSREFLKYLNIYLRDKDFTENQPEIQELTTILYGLGYRDIANSLVNDLSMAISREQRAYNTKTYKQDNPEGEEHDKTKNH